jgi:DNA-directed RNA polymerase specialized sigma24 family protein
MSNRHPIIPPPELVQEWWDKVPGTFTSMVDETHLATQAAQWGADQELEATLGLMATLNIRGVDYVRNARRPKPPSLKEQALSELNLTADPDGAELSRTQVELIRRALEALPND